MYICIIYVYMCVYIYIYTHTHTHISVQALSHVPLFGIPWTTAGQASLSISNSWSLLKLMPVESVMPSNYLNLCRPLLLLKLLMDTQIFKFIIVWMCHKLYIYVYIYMYIYVYVIICAKIIF